MLKIQNLHVFVEDKEIVKGVSLTINKGEIHALMGPNGSGKTTLAYAVMGNPEYKVLSPKSKIELDGKGIKGLTPDKRARMGLFLAFQTPVAVPGVNVSNLLRNTYQGQDLKRKSQKFNNVLEFNQMLEKKCDKLRIDKGLLRRSLNEDFSGGEKKKMEVFQMMVLKPKYAIVDEIDTGLDIDALKIVARAIKKLAAEGVGMLLITHYQRILRYLKPSFVHVMVGGKIVKSGEAKLAKEIEEKGYRNLKF